MLRFFQYFSRENVKIPVFANGNILFLKNVYECMNFTGCDGVMIAEGSLQNPCLFNDLYPSVWEICREYMIFVKSYDCPLTWLRGHIFKMCRKV
jgi:tRNA-dihydrouridine synthase 1